VAGKGRREKRVELSNQWGRGGGLGTINASSGSAVKKRKTSKKHDPIVFVGIYVPSTVYCRGGARRGKRRKGATGDERKKE